MFHWLWLAVVSLVGYYVYSKIDFYLRERKFRKLHGTERPPLKAGKLPFGLDIYSVIMWNFENQSLPEWARSESLKWGNTYAVRFLGSTSITTAEPRNIQAVLTAQFKDFGIGPPRIGSFGPLLGSGIFSMDGRAWEHSRALLRPQFTRDQITQLENMEEHIKIMIDCIPTDGRIVDLQELFFELTIDTATHFLFGESCETLMHRRNVLRGEVNEIPVGNRFARAFDLSQRHIVNRYRLRKYYYMHNPEEFKEANRICHEFADKYVHRAIEHHNRVGLQEPEKPGKKRYVFLEEIAKETQDPTILRDALLNILLAGRDTTASLLSFVFYLLVRHPEVEEKLRAAIKEHFGEDDGSLLTFDKLKSCKYLRWVIDETLRLYPVVPFNVRAAIEDTTLPLGGGADGKSPIFVPKGTSIEYSVYTMHRREDIWGPDSNCFRPERFGESHNKEGFGNFEYLPFNGGPRICLGQQFALVEASYAIVKLFQRFTRFENGEPNPFMKLNATLTMCVGGKGVLAKCFKD
ncbi:Cytochrome P450 [Drechslerella dactyloides]|uniref:Cytochrome P450 n=1 Tax=Drechslerella dactyloides TaxID=74499 RepID=A0AAD6IRH1_DREDA|nr:Cytochrome P450 [Drechslerella dactyloides]